jgi:site-specific recombinase XerC
LQARQISDFVQQEAANKRGGSRKLPSTAMRSVLRFLVFSGELSPGLEAAALAPRQWTHDSIPQRLRAQEVERVLSLYAGETPVELRNRAILMLLSRLGLRAHEVVNLRLEDINWHEAHVVSAPPKTTMTGFYLCRKMSVKPWLTTSAGDVPPPPIASSFSTSKRHFDRFPILERSVGLPLAP